ncbi:MAG: cytochrome c-type biogenesis protein [Bdellovibrionota bacterium]
MNPAFKMMIFFMLSLAFLSPSSDAQTLEQQQKTLESKLMAPCCWGGTLDQHFSSLAQEMKVEIHDRLSQGQSPQQILDHFEREYGERVLSTPTSRGVNVFAWIIPIVVLFGGGWAVGAFLRGQKKQQKQDLSQDIPTVSQELDHRIDRELYRS